MYKKRNNIKKKHYLCRIDLTEKIALPLSTDRDSVTGQTNDFYNTKRTFMKAFVFTGQGAQFSGMGKELYESNDAYRKMVDLQKLEEEGGSENA